jgi:hypothetical protein
MITILKKDVETLLDKKIGIEDNQTERERQDIIARSDFKEIPNRFLRSELSALYSVTHKFRGIAFWCGIISRQFCAMVATYESMHLLLV